MAEPDSVKPPGRLLWLLASSARATGDSLRPVSSILAGSPLIIDSHSNPSRAPDPETSQDFNVVAMEASQATPQRDSIRALRDHPEPKCILYGVGDDEAVVENQIPDMPCGVWKPCSEHVCRSRPAGRPRRSPRPDAQSVSRKAHPTNNMLPRTLSLRVERWRPEGAPEQR